MRNHYEVLGVAKTATEDEIKKAYRQKAKELHPDRNSGDLEATERFKEVQGAYEVLSDPAKKSVYDRTPFRRKTTNNPGGPPPGSSYEDVMEEFFGGSSFKGRNITVRLEIDFKEVLSGCTKNIKVKKRKRCTRCQGSGNSHFQPCTGCGGTGSAQVPDSPFQFLAVCPLCKGSGKAPGSIVKCGDCIGSGYLPGYFEKALSVKIPPGIDNGMQVRLTGEGEESVREMGRSGDVMAFVLVKDHPIFNREGANITVEIPVSFTQLVLGDEIEIPTLEGSLKVKVPPGSQSHTKFRLKGKGFPTGQGTVGDLLATLKVETPKSLDEEYKKVIEQLAEVEKTTITARREQWAKKVEENSK